MSVIRTVVGSRAGFAAAAAGAVVAGAAGAATVDCGALPWLGLAGGAAPGLHAPTAPRTTNASSRELARTMGSSSTLRPAVRRLRGAQLGAACGCRGLVERQRGGIEDDAIALTRRFERHVALAHVVGDARGRALQRVAVAATAARLQNVRLARAELQHAHLAVRHLLDRAVGAADRELVRQRVVAAEQPPRGAVRALDARVERHLAQHPHHLPHAQATPIPAGAAGILAQADLLEHAGELRLDRLGRAVVGVAVVDADHRAHAVAVVLRAPAAARQADARHREAPGARVRTENVRAEEIGVVAR